MTLARKVFQMIAHDLVFDGFRATISLQLQQQRLGDVRRANARRIEGLHQSQRRLQVCGLDPKPDAQILGGQIEKSALIEIAKNRLSRLTHRRINHREIELLLQMLLQGHRRHDRFVQMLTPLLILTGPLRHPPLKDPAVTPVIVGFIQKTQRIHFLRVRPLGIERNRLGRILEHRIGLKRLRDDLRELQRAGLQNLQALAHLRRERLALRERLVEGDFRHGRRLFATAMMRRMKSDMKQNSCQKLKRKSLQNCCVFCHQSSPLAQDFLGMAIRKRVS